MHYQLTLCHASRFQKGCVRISTPSWQIIGGERLMEETKCIGALGVTSREIGNLED